MSGDISKDEVRAMLEVQSKNVEQLTIIANHLSNIVDKSSKIQDRLYNGLAQDISDKITEVVEECNKRCSEDHSLLKKNWENFPTCLDTHISNSSIAKDITHVKWFIAIFGILLLLTNLFVKVSDSHTSKNPVKAVIEHINKE